ncbi:hypothetical protein [Clostridium sp.]|uniref:hypothetical protein n=1 Tax=Clostridium sp. TaxID=1506 RepID=UPI003D6D441F
MKTKFNIILSALMILIISATACSKSKNEVPSLLNDVNSIEIHHGSGSEIVYTKEKDSEQIKKFMNAYNEAKPGDNSLGTTPNSEIIINYANGEKVSVSGGSQGFQTVIKGDKQFNIQGDKLWDYFKELNIKFNK